MHRVKGVMGVSDCAGDSPPLSCELWGSNGEFLASIWKNVSSSPGAAASQPCPNETTHPMSYLVKDESTGVHPVPLGWSLSLWGGPCPSGVHPLPTPTCDGCSCPHGEVWQKSDLGPACRKAEFRSLQV